MESRKPARYNLHADAELQEDAPLKLFDPRRGDSPFRIEILDAKDLQRAVRVNYFSIFWIRTGTGLFHTDLQAYPFNGPALLFANPYQTIFISSARGLSGMRLNFHANFFCIETYHEEVGCNGVLFNNIYGAPILPVPEDQVHEIENVLGSMQKEAERTELAQSELLVSYLKIFLIKATRIKVNACESQVRPEKGPSDLIKRLTELIELHYQKEHSPSGYAKQLAISEKALNKIVKQTFGRTLTFLIRERILKHAKWHLLHTRKPVKEIAAELGYKDELYFSRLFKRAAGLAPKAFREFETAIRGGRNLSM